MEISWGELNQSNVDFIVLSLQNFHGWSILISKMLQTAFAVVTGQRKITVPWLHLQGFLTGSVQQANKDNIFGISPFTVTGAHAHWVWSTDTPSHAAKELKMR